jgi:DMSO/TMAO reductase YedYZ molybdopterin-dependent catalytic subunit
VRFTRRRFLVGLGGLAAAVVGVERLIHADASRSPAASGSGGAVGSGDSFPVRTVDEVPRAKLEDWSIEVGGFVARTVKVDAASWASLPRFRETVDFHCVEGWSVGPVTWGGVRPSDVIALAGPLAEATHAVFHAFDGTYSDSLTLEQVRDPRTILADSLDGAPLPPDHGGPVRLIVPNQYAYKSVKFVCRIELTAHPERGYWEQRGYPVEAPVSG